ncbi:MAG: DUF222 domain-containing protein [Tessaracoccus sp.]|uniref:DUF222 domain-containing protein n=1 Tax=Tessaracoccus sp. TaxID=1971211 RepID=UPI001EBF3C6C|nr:DUF222 domain-containing protein [Tessaracoccus sp.]MBK7821131.1 DUF222 domain-containing protein [Tessaracoccus sp.]
MKDTALSTARQAAQRLTRAEEMRRRGEADKVEALCDLALAYGLDDEELFIEVLLDNKIQLGGSGTPLVSEMVSLEIAALLGIPAMHAASELSAALDLKCRHPRLYEAMINLEIEVDRVQMMSSRCRDLHPMLLDEVTDAWLRQQHKLTWTQAKKLVDRLVVQADPEAAAKRERAAREQRGVWLWGLSEGVMNLTGVLDILDARFLDARLTEVAGLIEPHYPGLTAAQRRAKAAGVLANPATGPASAPATGEGRGLCLPATHRGGCCGDTGCEESVGPQDGGPARWWAGDPDHGQWQVGERDLQPRCAGSPPPAWHHGRPGAMSRCLVHPDGSPCTGFLTCPHTPTAPVSEPEPFGPRGFPVAGESSAYGQGRGAEHTCPGACRHSGETPAGHGDTTPSGQSVETSYCHGPGCSCPDVPRTRRFDPHQCAGHHCGTIQVPVAKLRPSLGIAVHIHADALGHLDPAARIEKAGTITTTLLAELLGEGKGIDIKIQPVIDLPNLAPADGYVPSQTMRCGMVLAFPNEPFPFSQRDTQGLDLGRTVAFQPGQRGQTRVGNLAPLTRRVHRAKTTGYWVMHQPEPGRIEWRSPLGYRYDVTPFGTERCQPIRIDYDDRNSVA